MTKCISTIWNIINMCVSNIIICAVHSVEPLSIFTNAHNDPYCNFAAALLRQNITPRIDGLFAWDNIINFLDSTNWFC